MDPPEIILDSEPTWKNQSLQDYLTHNIPDKWESFFEQSSVKDIIAKISLYLSEEKRTIWPFLPNLLNAFFMCPFDKLKVVIIGQDPYHTPNTAYGLAFSTCPKGNFPPSLKNIFTKLKQEGFTAKNPCLESWARQGVFLINTALTVAESSPESHLKIWTDFTMDLIKFISKKEKVVWILWGGKAQMYRGFIKPSHSKLIEGGHPSPMNTTGSFLDKNYFRECNQYLQSKNITPINWNL